jgi:5-methyltetrahydrofolate--homocysteine methyltransferase
MHPVLRQILAHGPVLTDGAWGTELQSRGLNVGEFPDSWNLSHPDEVAEVADAYVQAGSQIILTNTFGANRLRLQDHGMGNQVFPINFAGVKISRKAAAGRCKVFASIGPSGKLLLDGDVTSECLRDAFIEQAGALAEAGADGLVIETMSDLEEARQAVAAARTTNLPVVACMVFDSGKNKDRTMMGHAPEQVGQVLTEEGADVIGANCGQGISGFVPICRRLRGATDLPIWIKANAGLPTVVDGRISYHVTPAEFATFIPELLASGASFLGGCCGTSPAFIQAIARGPGFAKAANTDARLCSYGGQQRKQ